MYLSTNEGERKKLDSVLFHPQNKRGEKLTDSFLWVTALCFCNDVAKTRSLPHTTADTKSPQT